MTVIFHQAPVEHLEIEVLGYAYPKADNYYDMNWLNVHIKLIAGKFSGQTGAYFLTDEIESFYKSLHTLHKTLSGVAEFTTLEGQLRLRLEATSAGQVNLRGSLSDQAGIGHELNFHWASDQSYLAEPLRDLEKAMRTFPVRRPSVLA